MWNLPPIPFFSLSLSRRFIPSRLVWCYESVRKLGGKAKGFSGKRAAKDGELWILVSSRRKSSLSLSPSCPPTKSLIVGSLCMSIRVGASDPQRLQTDTAALYVPCCLPWSFHRRLYHFPPRVFLFWSDEKQQVYNSRLFNIISFFFLFPISCLKRKRRRRRSAPCWLDGGHLWS